MGLTNGPIKISRSGAIDLYVEAVDQTPSQNWLTITIDCSISVPILMELFQNDHSHQSRKCQ
jgi:hypothetical protein